MAVMQEMMAMVRPLETVESESPSCSIADMMTGSGPEAPANEVAVVDAEAMRVIGEQFSLYGWDEASWHLTL